MSALLGAAFAVGPAGAASNASDITGLSITPTATADSTGGNVCQRYTVTETGSASGASTVTVNLQPTGAIDSEFCGTGAGNPSPSDGSLDSKTFTPSNSTFMFGVKDNDPSPSTGNIQITAFPENGTTTPTTGAPTASATQAFVTGTSQDNIVTSLKATPSNQTVSEGGKATYTVTASNGNAVVEGVGNIKGTVTSSQGNPTGSSVNCSSSTNSEGQVTCTVSAPVSSPVQSGPYTVTFSVPSTANGGTTVSTTATLTTAPPAPTNATVTLTCGGSSTERTANNACVEPTSDSTETFKATVTTPPATTGGATVPVPGVVVDFSAANGGGGTFDNNSCVTGTDGTCSVTLTANNPSQGNTITVTASLSTGAHATATVTFDNNFSAPPTNISVSAATDKPKTGSTDLVTAAVTNQFGNASGAGTDVFFTITGGQFTNGTTSQTVTTDLSGKAQISVTSATSGTATVTATLEPGTSTPNCNSPADPGSGASAGNCSATVTLSFSGHTQKTVEKPKLKVTSPHKGKIHFHATTHPRLAHVSVHFYKVTKSGHHKLLTKKNTNSNGVAKKTIKLTKGKKYTFDCKVVHLGSAYTSKYSASHSKRVKG